jgi:hypothetical protein
VVAAALPAVAVAVVVLVLGAACSSGDDDVASSLETTTTSSSGSRPTTAAGGTATTDPAIIIVLQPARLTVGGNALPFGAPLFQVSSFLERGLGEPIQEEDQQCDAGELHVIQWKSLMVFVGAEGLAGWYTDDRAHATDKAVRIGSSQRELQAAYPTGTVTETSLGTEFFFDAGDGKGLSAIIQDGDVSTLFSGATCIAR